MGCGRSKIKDDEEKRRLEEEMRKKKEEEDKRLEEERKKLEELRNKDERERLKRERRGDKEEKKEEDYIHRDANDDTDVGYEDEIYDGENYGKPIRIGKQTWMTYDFGVVPNTTTPRVFCPVGWRTPTVMDYLVLFKHLENNVYAELTNVDKLNMDTDKIYVTSTKVNQDQHYGNQDESWIFKCVAFDRDRIGINTEPNFHGNPEVGNILT